MEEAVVVVADMISYLTVAVSLLASADRCQTTVV